MRIGMVLLTSYPPDIRLEKEIDFLKKKHQVFLLCTNRHNDKKIENSKGVKIKRIHKNTFIRWVSNIQILIFKRSFIWEYDLLKFIKDEKIDVLHVHDLPLLYSAYKSANKVKIPIVSDLHENFPEMLRESKRKPLLEEFTLPQILKKIISVNSWKKHEKKILPKIKNIIVVIEEAKQRLVNELKIKSSEIWVVPNYDIHRNISFPSKGENKITIIYCGGFDSVRDLDTVLKSVIYLSKEARKKIEIKLIGGTQDENSSLKNLACDLGVIDVVKILPHLKFEKMYKHLLKSDIGLVAHKKSLHTDNTIPHKLFQYMGIGMPVIVSNCNPLIRIVNDENCGLIYKSKNPKSLAEAITKICLNKPLRTKMGINSINAINNKYNWNNATKALNDIYDKMSL